MVAAARMASPQNTRVPRDFTEPNLIAGPLAESGVKRQEYGRRHGRAFKGNEKGDWTSFFVVKAQI
jgi:hypothetical protein